MKAAREVVDAVLQGQRRPGPRRSSWTAASLLVNARPLPAGGAVLVLHDLTDLRRLETMRRDFVANVSHELKTPLTSISGYAETLLTDTPTPDTTRRFLETILSNARRMQRLVDDLLDLSRIEAGRWQPDLERGRRAAVARESWAALAGRPTRGPSRSTLEVASRAPSSSSADPDAVRQVLTNLLDNSLRYTPTGGEITCVARRAEGGVAVERPRQRPRDRAGAPAPHLRAVLPGRPVALAGAKGAPAWGSPS